MCYFNIIATDVYFKYNWRTGIKENILSSMICKSQRDIQEKHNEKTQSYHEWQPIKNIFYVLVWYSCKIIYKISRPTSFCIKIHAGAKNSSDEGTSSMNQ